VTRSEESTGIDERMQDAPIGHENKHVSSVYGKGYGARRRFEELSKVRYPGLELAHLHIADGNEPTSDGAAAAA
jgi:hypothetical protein